MAKSTKPKRPRSTVIHIDAEYEPNPALEKLLAKDLLSDKAERKIFGNVVNKKAFGADGILERNRVKAERAAPLSAAYKSYKRRKYGKTELFAARSAKMADAIRNPESPYRRVTVGYRSYRAIRFRVGFKRLKRQIGGKGLVADALENGILKGMELGARRVSRKEALQIVKARKVPKGARMIRGTKRPIRRAAAADAGKLTPAIEAAITTILKRGGVL